MKNNLHKGGFDFLTIGDKKYFDLISLSVNQINKIYPDAKIFIYDWGFTPNQAGYLKRQANVEVIRWSILNLHLAKLCDLLKVFIKGGFSGKYKEYLSFIRHIRLENLYANKVFVFGDHAKKHSRNFVFLDGDAFIINKFDELFEKNFDIGVTLRRKNEVDIRFGNCNALNSGVIFFFGGEKNKKFIELWMKKMNNINERYIEQTALSRMLLEVNQDIFTGDYKSASLHSDNEKIIIKTLPCEIYNYNWIEEGVDFEHVKILHFKCGRYHTKEFNHIVKILSER